MSVALEALESHPDFSKLKAELLARTDGLVLYEDPVFEPSFTILFNKQSRIDFHPSEIVWNRPNQLSKHPSLVVAKDLKTMKPLRGRLTPDWFPVLFSLLVERNLLDLVIPNLKSQNNFRQSSMVFLPSVANYCGAFQFRFRRGGLVEDVVIDDRLPTSLNKSLLTATEKNEDVFLPALLEKAYAKFVGGYYNLESTDYLTALMDFTGALVETIPMHGNDLLTTTELESFFSKVTSLVGDSFVLCEIGQKTKKGNRKLAKEIYIINGIIQIPIQPPESVGAYILSSFDSNINKLIPVVRMFSFFDVDNLTSRINGRCLSKVWDESSFIVKKNYGIVYNDTREKWVPVEELPYFCDKVIIVHMLYRNSIMALAKKQEYWKYYFIESFWHRDGPRGDIETIEDEFLKNNQYICKVKKENGCNIKMALTITQKYVDSGANTIKKILSMKTGITILEVERNRQYRLHNLEHVKVIPSHTDAVVDRVLIISSVLYPGSYVIIPWISIGAGTRYTLQLFSDASDTEFMKLDKDCPDPVYCISCKLRKTILKTKANFAAKAIDSPRKLSFMDSDMCGVCRSSYPKRATKISVLDLDFQEVSPKYTLPTLIFIISCESERYKSKPLQPSSNAHWDEHFIFYRNAVQNSSAKIEIFMVGQLKFEYLIATHLFSEKELRDNKSLSINVYIPIARGGPARKCTLTIVVKNYFPSEFHLV